MARRGQRILEGVNIEVSEITKVKTPSPTQSDKDSDDLGVKLRYVADKLDDLINALASVGTDKLLTTPDNPPNLDVALSTRASETTLSEIKNPITGELRNQDLTVAQELVVDLEGKSVLEVVCKADAATTFTVILSFDGTTEDYTLYQSPSPETTYRNVWTVGARYVKVKSAAAGSAGDKVSLLVSGK